MAQGFRLVPRSEAGSLYGVVDGSLLGAAAPDPERPSDEVSSAAKSGIFPYNCEFN